MTDVYVPGTEETDLKKYAMSLQQIGPRLATAEGNITTLQTTIASSTVVGTTTNDNAASGHLGEYVSCISPNNTSTGAVLTATVTITNASPGVVSWTGHGIPIAGPVYFTTTGGLPTGLSTNTNYYVSSAGYATDSFQVSSSVANALAGTSINTSSAGSGTHTGHAGVIILLASSGTAINLGGISLTAGDWDVSLQAAVPQGAGQTTSFILGSISATSATFDLSSGRWGNSTWAAGTALSGTPSVGVFPARFSLSSTTTIYSIIDVSFAVAASCEAYGALRARRVR